MKFQVKAKPVTAKRWLAHEHRPPKPANVKGKLVWPLEPFEERGVVFNSLVWESACGRYHICRAIHHYDQEDHCFAALIRRVYEHRENGGFVDHVYWDTFDRSSHVKRYATLEQACAACEEHANKECPNKEELLASAKAYGIADVPNSANIRSGENATKKPSSKTFGPKALRGGGLFGHPVTAVLRWMGANGWDNDEARGALTKLGVDIADGTISAQVGAGKRGLRGPPAALSDEQIEQLIKAKS